MYLCSTKNVEFRKKFEQIFATKNFSGPSSRIRLIEAEPGTSQNRNRGHPIGDSDSDSGDVDDDDDDFRRFVAAVETADADAAVDPDADADADSREAWAASSSEVQNSSSFEDNFSPRPSNWTDPSLRSVTTG